MEVKSVKKKIILGHGVTKINGCPPGAKFIDFYRSVISVVLQEPNSFLQKNIELYISVIAAVFLQKNF